MMDRLPAGSVVGGFRIGERLHAGGAGYIYRVSAATAHDPGFPLAMKVPAVGRGEPTVGIVGFETELMIVPTLSGPHVPRFVTGELTATPHLVMEWIEGEGLATLAARAPLSPADVARIGAALADAVHSLHTQDTIHLDLKPENVILRPDGEAVVIDFGFAHHARLPDLLAEEMAFASGSAPYVSPEQLRDNRNDPRSDIFALGAILYELATAEPPFGAPAALSGMRDRLWREPVPPRARNPEVPPWLQEVILRCLEVSAAARYQSAAHVAFDLRHPEQIALSARAHRTRAEGFLSQLSRWWHSRDYALSAPLPKAKITETPVIMVAVDTSHPDDHRQPSIQWAARQVLSLGVEYRAMCVSVIRAAPLGEGATLAQTASGQHLEHLMRLRQWVAPLGLPAQRLSLHVIESASPADTLLELARKNNVDLIVVGAPGPAEMKFGWWRSVASGVTAKAHCSVHVVRVPERRSER